jgi:hypothetical protein
VIDAVFGDDVGMAGGKTMTTARIFLLCAAAAVSACNKDTPAPVSTVAPRATANAPVVKKGPSAAELTAGMVQAASAGKSQVPVELKFELASRPKVGQPLEINLALISHIDAGAASLHVTGADGFILASEGTQLDLPAAQADEVYRHNVNVTPTAEGILVVAVTVSLKHDEVVDQRIFSIPIIAER